MRIRAEDLTDEQRRGCMVLWNLQRLDNCIAVDTEEGWADVCDLLGWDWTLDTPPVHRVYGDILLVLKAS